MSQPATEDPAKQIRNVAIAMGGFGVTGIGFGGFSLFVVTAQKAIMRLGFEQSKETERVTELMGGFHTLWSLWMPLLCVVGVLWVVCGVLLGFSGIKWQPLCLLGVVIGFAWIFGYSYSAHEMLSHVSNVFVDSSSSELLPQTSKTMMKYSSLFSMLMLTSIPSVVAYLLLRLKPPSFQK